MWIRVALVAAITLAGCGGITFDDDNAVEGTYTLRAVNFRALPYAPNDRILPLTVTSGRAHPRRER
jgi:hypothetical protein